MFLKKFKCKSIYENANKLLKTHIFNGFIEETIVTFKHFIVITINKNATIEIISK